MRFIIYGAGAIGSIIGGHLHRASHEVVLVGNERHVDRIRTGGLRLVTPDETYTLRIQACKRAKELAPFREDDVVILTAKSQHTALCLGQLKNAGAGRELPIFCAQNSMVNEPYAGRVFDGVYGVVVNLPGIFMEPGEVVNPIEGNWGFLELGRYPRGSDSLAREVSSALISAGFVGGVSEWVMKAKGAKTLLNLGNSLEAITDGRGDSREFMRAVRAEAEEVWRLAGIEYEGLAEYQRRVASVRGKNRMPRGYGDAGKRSSTWQSLARGSGSVEADALNGDVVRLGRALGVSAPHNDVLRRLAEDMASKGERPGRYTLEDLTLMVKEGQVSSSDTTSRAHLQ